MTDERIDRVDRFILRILGAFSILLGIAGLLHALGILGNRRRESPIIASPTAAWYAHNGAWVWPVAAAVLLVVAAGAIWWVTSQVRLQGSSRIELERSSAGNLDVAGGFLADCVERDAINQQGIERARARVTTTDEAVQVWLTIWVGPPYDVGAAVARVANTVLPNLSTTLDGSRAQPLRTHITVETAEATVSRLA